MIRRLGVCLASIVALLGASVAPAPSGSGGRQAEVRDVTIAVAGDMIGPYRSIIRVDSPGFAAVRRLFEHADAGFANQEGSIFEPAEFSGWPAAENGGGTPLSPPVVAREMAIIGVDMMSKANNHATDWGTEGLILTERALRAAGITFAGSGPDERAARAPAFRDTPVARIGLVSTASSFVPMSRAGDAVHSPEGRPLRARPGISVLRAEPAMLADAEEIAALRAFADRRGMRASSERVRIGRQTFQLSDLLGGTYDANAADRRAVLDAVTASAREADLTIFTIHAHETASSAGPRGLAHISPGDDPVPADFLPPLFRKAIDAGAAMVVRHGPHTLNGIEIYKGRPIFYSLGSLFFDFRGRRSYRVPGTGRTLHFPDHWFESAVATVRYRGGELVEVRLYPVMIEVSPYPTNGLPLLATGADAQRILARLQLHSAPFGTQIRIEGDVGVISGPAS